MGFAFVTGASGGIGSAIASRLAADGYHVGVGYRSRKAVADDVVAGLAGSGHMSVSIDVRDPRSVDAAAAAIRDSVGRCDVLVNCAGVTVPVAHDDLDGLTDEMIDEIFETNWRGAYATIRAFAPLLRTSDNGCVVNVSSIAAVTGVGSNVAYCAAKAGLDSMTRSLARSLSPRIRVNSVSPGWVRGEYADRMPAGVLQQQQEATPLGRLAIPDDVAAAVAGVVDNLKFTTGAVIPVDGGRQLGTLR